jgi:hypothetical protein
VAWVARTIFNATVGNLARALAFHTASEAYMTEAQTLQKLVERALAFAHAAVDDPTEIHVIEARSYAQKLVPQLGRLKRPPFTMSEASLIVSLVSQLRAVLEVLNRLMLPAHKQPLPS